MIGKWKASLTVGMMVAASWAVSPSAAHATVECGAPVPDLVASTGTDVIAEADGSSAYFGAQLWAMEDPTTHAYCGSEQARIWMRIPTTSPHWGKINFELENCQAGTTLKTVKNDNATVWDDSNWCSIYSSRAGVFGWFGGWELPADFTPTWPD